MERFLATAVGVIGLLVAGVGFWMTYRGLVEMQHPINGIDSLAFILLCGGTVFVGLVLLMLGIIGEAVITARRATVAGAAALVEMKQTLQREADRAR